ncbi:MAG TPA: ribosome maturation factor RimP [Clostridiaceae bacterium]|nr:ribosome maturation factor RimP [Clostridiaceae bacterium]
MKIDLMIKKLMETIEPIVAALNYELYHLEYVKEAGEYYLRIYIDSENGISFEDCEKISRRISEALDLDDPIEEAYYLEVSSPGIERGLYTDKHLEKFIGSDVNVKLNKLMEGKKALTGKLVRFDAESITFETEGAEVSIPRDIIKSLNISFKF